MISENNSEEYQPPIHNQLKALVAKKILVVDDREINRVFIKTWLEPYPIEVIEADSGEQALDVANNTSLDLIIMDVNFGKMMSGIEACRAIRQHDKNTWLVFYTGNVSESDIEEYTRAGGDSFLIKPIDLNIFWQLIEDVFIKGVLRSSYLELATDPVNDYKERVLDAAGGDAESAIMDLEVFLTDVTDIVERIDRCKESLENLKDIIHVFANSCSFARLDFAEDVNKVEDLLKDDRLEDAVVVLTSQTFLTDLKSSQQMVQELKAKLKK